MRISDFSVRNQRAIRLAACNQVPKVMVITGPNGCGKSTLLNAIRNVGTGDGRTLYVGPHRTSRRQHVRMRFLSQQRIEMGALLSAQSLPGFEGISLPSHERDAWNYDETQSFLKYSLCQIELDRQTAIASRYDAMGSVTRADIPDVWLPLRELTHNLLPHLQFHRIDVSNRDQIRCLWQVHSKDVLVDIDDLSSGEKAVIQLFFPLIEHQIAERLAKISGTQAASAMERDVAVLMDEPELHLHPHSQAKVLEYIRSTSLSEPVQFILTTHSPSMVEQTSSDELYLLRPSELVQQDENQLVRIATTDERLQTIREVFGSTSNVTAMRKIVVVEGVSGGPENRRAADARIYAYLNERLGQVNIVAAGGKSEVRALVSKINHLFSQIAPSLTATALLDRDLEESHQDGHETEILLPVSMIENLLLDPDAIWNAISLVRHKTTLNSAADVGMAIDRILDELAPEEVSRRVKNSVASRTFRLRDPIEEAQDQVREFADNLLYELSAENVGKLVAEAKASVAKLETQHKRREFFDGKRVLTEFHKRYLHSTGMAREIFIYGCAREASRRKSVSAFIEVLFGKLGIVDASRE